MAKVLFKNSAPVKKNNHLLLVTHPTPSKMFMKIRRQHFSYAVDIDIMCRIGLAASAMRSLQDLWRQQKINKLATKL